MTGDEPRPSDDVQAFVEAHQEGYRRFESDRFDEEKKVPGTKSG